MPFSNADILNLIRDNAGLDYQNRVPEATRDNLAETGNAITEYDPQYNEFARVLINKIIMQIIERLRWEHPFRRFKGGMLPIGTTIEQVHVELAKAIARVDVEEEAVFRRTLPDISVIYHTINREDVYPVSVFIEKLGRAMLTEGGLDSLVTEIIQSLYNGDEKDEYLIFKNLIAQYSNNRFLYPVSIPAPIDKDSTTEAVVQIRKACLDLEFMVPHYNSLGVHQATPLSGQIIFIKTEFESRVSVEVLAAAFNMDKADYLATRIKVDDFGLADKSLQMVLVDEKFFVQRDTVYETTSIFNPITRTWNYWLHHSGIYSTNRFANAVGFYASDVSATGVIVNPQNPTFAAGTNQMLSGQVVGTTGTYVPQALSWSIITATTDRSTFVDRTGRLFIGVNETAPTITVIATSVFNPSVFGATTVTVTPILKPSVTGITINPATVSIVQGDTQQFTATVTGVNGMNDTRVLFQINGAPTNSTITTAGLLNVGLTETATTFQVVATSLFDPTKNATATVTVTPAP